MLKRLLSALGGKTSSQQTNDDQRSRKQAPGIEYKGFEIVAAPESMGGQFRVSGLIRKRAGEKLLGEYAFERSDVVPSHAAAVELMQQKAQRFIDDMDCKLFD